MPIINRTGRVFMHQNEARYQDQYQLIDASGYADFPQLRFVGLR